MIGRLFCRIGLHAWRRIWGDRHWHMECRRCGARDLWLDARPGSGFHPIDHNWARKGER